MIASEALVLAVTWYKTAQLYLEARRLGISAPLAKMLIRDGEIAQLIEVTTLDFLTIRFLGTIHFMCVCNHSNSSNIYFNSLMSGQYTYDHQRTRSDFINDCKFSASLYILTWYLDTDSCIVSQRWIRCSLLNRSSKCACPW